MSHLLVFLSSQYALRKLYHESPRLVCVLYTSPTCGPCRTLKPILNKVQNSLRKFIPHLFCLFDKYPYHAFKFLGPVYLMENQKKLLVEVVFPFLVHDSIYQSVDTILLGGF